MTPDLNGSHRLVMLQFKPLWDYIDDVRDFCSGFVKRSFGDDEVGQGVGMIVHELVENAIRYGDEKELMLRIERSDDAIVVCVANTTTDDAGIRLRKVMKELEDLSPFEAYERALRRSTSLPAKESGLGIPRILHEGKAELQVDIAPGRVSIMARRSA